MRLKSLLQVKNFSVKSEIAIERETIVNDKNLQAEAQMKMVWVRPELSRIEAGSAESGTLMTPDGGGGAQAS